MMEPIELPPDFDRDTQRAIGYAYTPEQRARWEESQAVECEVCGIYFTPLTSQKNKTACGRPDCINAQISPSFH